MIEYDVNDSLEFTNMAWESMYDVVDTADFFGQEAQLIYSSLLGDVKLHSFGDYLKRYIFKEAKLSGSYQEVPLSEYQAIIVNSFEEHFTPQSFKPTTAKLSALAKNWLTQKTVKRNVVFLLGFGLGMSTEDVNEFLTKALCEPEIRPKDPFEVICWYCYENKYMYRKFVKLWEQYENTPHKISDESPLCDDRTISARSTMYTIQREAELWNYLDRLTTKEKVPYISISAREEFDRLFYEARVEVCRIKNASRPYSIEQITEADIESIISEAIPRDRHGNLTPAKASRLNELFAGRRFSRQRVGEILAGNTEINRFDLITLNFFLFSQKVKQYPNAQDRYNKFLDETNRILEKCSMGELYIQNPYEWFVLACILTDCPLCTYADVWELSYSAQ